MSQINDQEVFRDYAGVYDLLYQEKDYGRECDYLEEVFGRYPNHEVREILDLGCGTGTHAIELARRGYSVTGVDRSPEMIALAKRKGENYIKQGVLTFEIQDITALQLDDSFDVVICMFAVLGYQTGNENLFNTLKAVSSLLKPGGLFICDFWYGPAVLKHRPSTRYKIIQNGESKIIRFVSPEIDTNQNIVTVNYRVLTLQGDHVLGEVVEAHRMRYIFQPEISFMLEQAQMTLLEFSPFLESGQEPSEDNWNVSLVAETIVLA